MWANKNRQSKIAGRRLQVAGCRSQVVGCGFWFAAIVFLFGFQVCFAQDAAVVYNNDEGRRDPFIALVTPDGRILNLEPTGAGTKIVLGGVIYDEAGGSFAIINDEVVGPGDYIAGHTVLEIQRDKVVLLKDNERVEYIIEKEEAL